MTGVPVDSALVRWMALAYRAPLPAPARLDVALGSGPDSVPFPPEVLQREQEDLLALQDLGVRVLTLSDEDYPDRLRRQEDPPLLLHVAGRHDLLHEEGVRFIAGVRGQAGAELHEALEAGSRAVVLLSKGMLRARNELRGLRQAIEDGSIAVLSAEPPRAAWGPARMQRCRALCRVLTEG